MTDRNKYLDRSKSGQIYFRANKRRVARLPDDATSKDFATAYDRLRAAHEAGGGRPATTRRRPQQKTETKATIGWFIERYKESGFFCWRGETPPEFAEGTRANYRPALDDIKRVIGNGMLADLTPDNVDVYLAKIKRERADTTAALHKVLLSNLWQFARGFAEFKRDGRTNPTADAIRLYKVKQEHEPWPEEVQEKFLASCDHNLAFAFRLLLRTGQRVGDVCKMKWAKYDAKTKLYIVKQQKTGTPLTIMFPDDLAEMAEARDRVHDNILTHKWHRPYTRDSLGHRIKDVLIEVGAERYTAHGLRKNAGIFLAENGATVPQIMAALGHTSPKLALYYCRLANQKLLNVQAAEIINVAVRQQKATKVAARRAGIRRVK